MRKYGLMTCMILSLAARASFAQGGGLSSSPCPAGGVVAGVPDQTRIAQDVCTQAYDVYQFMARSEEHTSELQSQ